MGDPKSYEQQHEGGHQTSFSRWRITISISSRENHIKKNTQSGISEMRKYNYDNMFPQSNSARQRLIVCKINATNLHNSKFCVVKNSVRVWRALPSNLIVLCRLVPNHLTAEESLEYINGIQTHPFGQVGTAVLWYTCIRYIPTRQTGEVK